MACCWCWAYVIWAMGFFHLTTTPPATAQLGLLPPPTSCSSERRRRSLLRPPARLRPTKNSMGSGDLLRRWLGQLPHPAIWVAPPLVGTTRWTHSRTVRKLKGATARATMHVPYAQAAKNGARRQGHRRATGYSCDCVVCACGVPTTITNMRPRTVHLNLARARGALDSTRSLSGHLVARDESGRQVPRAGWATKAYMTTRLKGRPPDT